MPIRTPDPATVLSFRNNLRDCTLCDLRTTARAPVPWYGNIGATIAIIGEAPGRTEDKEGRPFVGGAGNRLRALMRQADIDLNDIAYVNSCQCFPARGLDINADREYINECRKWMRGQIAFIQPTYVITVGVVALYSVRKQQWPKLRELHGKPMLWDDPPLPARPKIWPTYHPAAALRSGRYQRLIEDDLAAFVKWRDGDQSHPECCYICTEELYRWDSFGIGYCQRHAMRQIGLFPEDI